MRDCFNFYCFKKKGGGKDDLDEVKSQESSDGKCNPSFINILNILNLQTFQLV